MQRATATADDPGSNPAPVRRPAQSQSPGALVVGYDGSPAARAAVDLAVDRAARRGSRLIIAHAGPDGRVLDALMLDGHDALADLDWEARAVVGAPARALMRLAGQVGADEVIVGSRGRGRTGAVMGSTVERLVGHGGCPITVVPTGAAPRMEHDHRG